MATVSDKADGANGYSIVEMYSCSRSHTYARETSILIISNQIARQFERYRFEIHRFSRSSLSPGFLRSNAKQAWLLQRRLDYTLTATAHVCSSDTGRVINLHLRLHIANSES